MAWTNITFAFGSTLSSSKMTQLDDNFDALAAGSIGAPKIQTAALEQTGGSEAVTAATIRAVTITQAKMAVPSIGQAQLKTGLQQVSGNATQDVAYTAGTYHFQWGLSDSGGGQWSPISYNSGAYTNGIRINRLTASTFFFQTRYITASPPYDLGDGPIPLFAFVLLDKATGKPLCVSLSEDPPWAYNGPTCILPDYYDSNGKAYQNRLVLPSGERLHKSALKQRAEIMGGSPAALDAALSLLEMPQEAVEITQQIKNADIGLIPHPFLNFDASTQVVVLLDPVGAFNEKLYRLLEIEEPVSSIIMDHVHLDNVHNGAKGPPGVLCVSAKWRNTQ